METGGARKAKQDGGNASTLLNERATAALLGLTEATLRRWRWAGKGPNWLKIGGAVRYEASAIAAYLEECRRGGQPA